MMIASYCGELFEKKKSLLAIAGALLLALAALLVAKPADAAFPGVNGRISFTTDRSGNSEVLAVNSNGTGLVNLSNSPRSDRDAAFSPDGNRIAYTREVNGNTDIYVKNLATGRVTRITTNLGVDASAAWAPSGRQIAFVSNRTGSACSEFDLYIVRTARESATNRPVRRSNTCGIEGNPEWSPRGNLIAFDLGLITWDVYVMAPNGAGRRAITDNDFGNSYFNPSWSPNGAQIAFDNASDVFKVDANTNGGAGCQFCTNLTPGTPGSIEEDPSWSPDGAQIAFETSRDELPDGSTNWEIYVMSAADGSGQTNVTQSAARDQGPNWGRRP